MNEASRIKVLHIDDDRGFLELFRKTYDDKFDIVSLPGGDDVPCIVEREAPGALILDYELPGRNGLELLSAIKEKYPSLPVIFYTGQGNEEVARQAFREGATDYFVKKSADFAQKEKVVNSVHKAVANRTVEEELAEKQAMLEGIIEYNPYSIMIADSKSRPIRINKAHTKLMGISPGPDGKIIFDEALSIPDEVKEAIKDEWEAKRDTYCLFNDENALKDDETKKLAPLWQKGEVVKLPPIWYTHPFPLVGSSMKPKCVGGTCFSIKNSRGGIVNYVQMHEDITARVEAEEALRKAHEDLKIVNEELTAANDELRKSYESVEQKVAERTAELAEANRKLAEANSQLGDANHQLTEVNDRLTDANTQLADVNFQLADKNRLLAEANTQLAEANLRLTDANTRLQAEIDERVRLQDQLERQNSELEGFSRTVSHDLRNNLNAMQRLMERGTLAADDKERTQKLLIENTAHLQHFVERLLDLAQAGKAISEKRKVSLDEIARKVFALAAASHGKVAAEGQTAAAHGQEAAAGKEAAAHGQEAAAGKEAAASGQEAAEGKAAASQGEAELSIITPFLPVLCDPGAFEQIFSNLFNNAFAHAMPDVKPLIQVECAVKDGTAEITVRDNGKGIEPGIASRIFDSTFTTKKGEHFGLGLAIVKKLVEAHGGKVRVESEGPEKDARKGSEKGAGKGAAFIITLPYDGQRLEQRLC